MTALKISRFNKLMGSMQVVKETTLTEEKKPLVLDLPYLGSICLQTITKFQKSLKWNLEIS